MIWTILGAAVIWLLWLTIEQAHLRRTIQRIHEPRSGPKFVDEGWGE
jgi:hypothetical protein